MIVQRQTSGLAQEAEQGINVLVAKAYALPSSRALDLPATIHGYKVIIAQFDGIISARFVDPGALIPQSTASLSGTPIVSISSMAPLRVYAYVPQNQDLV